MQGKREEIAARVREARECGEITAEDVAMRLDLSLGEYLAMERGEIDFPASLLHEIAQRFNTDLVTLLTGRDAKMHHFCVTRAGQGVEVKRRADYGYQNLAANFSGKTCEPFLVTVPVGTGRPHGNSHHGQEFNYVLSGVLKIYICDQELTLNPGDCIYFDSTQEHAMEAVGAAPAKFIAVINPDPVALGRR
ncbi:transcriptional regulator [Planctomycetales bacterium]|nr:transcriptional regulator [Planctomycetales bacterium]GHT08089.1 transcriptional regulator [Planctomycetales bacterium]GHV21832.1 transcriptional regulator [Planctomycetales bacterium]